MASAKVLIAEIDRSSRVPESSGVFGFMPMPLVRGRTDRAGFATSEEQFLNQTTPNGVIEPGMDLSYYVALDFLRRSNRLYWARAHNGAMLSGLAVPAEGTAAVPTRTTGFDDALAYNFEQGQLFLIYPTSEGVWGNSIGVKIRSYDREPNSFEIQVFYNDVMVENYPVTRVRDQRNGFGQSMFIEEVVRASQYIRVLDNDMMDESVMPKLITDTSTVWSAPATTQTFEDAQAALGQISTYNLEGRNVLNVPFPAQVGGTSFLIGANGSAIEAASAAARNETTVAEIASILNTGSQAAVNFATSAGAVTGLVDFLDRTPAASAGGNSTPATPGASADIQYRIQAPGYSRPQLGLTVDGTEVLFVPDESTTYTAAELVTNLVAVINADASLPYTASNVDAVLTLTRKVVGANSDLLSIDTSSLINVEVSGNAPTRFTGGADATAATATIIIESTGNFTPASFSVILGDGSTDVTHTVTVSYNSTGNQLAAALAQDITNSNTIFVAEVVGNVVTARSRLHGVAGNSYTNTLTVPSDTTAGASGGITVSTIKPLGGGVNRVAPSVASSSNTTAYVELGSGRYTDNYPQEFEGDAKVFEIQCSGNLTGTEQSIVVEGVRITIPATAITGSAVATAITSASAAIITAFPQLSTLAASSESVIFTYDANETFTREPRITVGAAIDYGETYTLQSFNQAVPGTPQVETITVTSAPTRNGTIFIGGIPVSVEVADGSNGTAGSIASALNSQSDIVATSNGNVVNVRYNTNGPRTRLAVDPVSTGVGVVGRITTTGVADIPATPKRTRIRIAGGNVYRGIVNVNIENVNCTIGGSSATASQVALDIANAEGWQFNQDIQSVIATGNEVEIEWTVAAGDHANPLLISGLTQFQTASPVSTRAFTEAVSPRSEIQSLTITSGNTSGSTELIYVDGQPISIESADRTPADVAARIVNSVELNQHVNIESVAIGTDSRDVVFTFSTAAGDVSIIEVVGGGTSAAALGGGTDGGPVTDTHMIRAIDLGEQLDFNISMDAGWNTPAHQRALASYAERRRHHIAILSVPFSAENASTYIEDIIDYRNNTLNLNTSFAALYTGHLRITDKFNDRQLWLPPSGAVGGLISTTIETQEPWFPVAGPRRGVLTFPTDVRRHFTVGEMDRLYDAGINPIRFQPGRGIQVWGQRTLLARPSALDRVNVRLLLIFVQTAMQEYLETFLFELNDAATRALIVGGADRFMEGVQARSGIYAFRNVCDESNNSPQDIDNYRLNFDQFLEPARGIEIISYRNTILATGALS